MSTSQLKRLLRSSSPNESIDFLDRSFNLVVCVRLRYTKLENKPIYLVDYQCDCDILLEGVSDHSFRVRHELEGGSGQ